MSPRLCGSNDGHLVPLVLYVVSFLCLMPLVLCPCGLLILHVQAVLWIPLPMAIVRYTQVRIGGPDDMSVLGGTSSIDSCDGQDDT